MTHSDATLRMLRKHARGKRIPPKQLAELARDNLIDADGYLTETGYLLIHPGRELLNDG